MVLPPVLLILSVLLLLVLLGIVALPWLWLLVLLTPL